jgi:hypothetical protein
MCMFVLNLIIIFVSGCTTSNNYYILWSVLALLSSSSLLKQLVIQASVCFCWQEICWSVCWKCKCMLETWTTYFLLWILWLRAFVYVCVREYVCDCLCVSVCVCVCMCVCVCVIVCHCVVLKHGVDNELFFALSRFFYINKI